MKFISKEEKVLYYILSITILIDIINGFVISSYNMDLSIGMISRVLIIILNIIYIGKYSKKSIIIFYFTIFPFILTTIVSFYTIHQNISALIYDFEDIFKIIYYISMIYSFSILNKHKKIRECIVNKIIINNAVFLVIGIFLTKILGVGLSSYEGNAGFKGTFYSLNALSSVTLVIFTILYDQILKNNRNKKNIILLISTLIIMLLLGAKALYFMIIFIFLSYIFTTSNYKIIIKNLCIISIVSFILILSVRIFFFDEISDILNRQLYFLNLRKDNMASYLLSTRNLYLQSALDGFFDNFSIRRVLIGIGVYSEQSEIASKILFAKYNLKGIEMDIFDIFFSYGLWGIINTYGLVIKICIQRLNKNFLEKKKYFISIITILIYSILGGHVFTEALSITFLNICVLGIISLNEGETYEEKNTVN